MIKFWILSDDKANVHLINSFKSLKICIFSNCRFPQSCRKNLLFKIFFTNSFLFTFE